jgi:hypothetical protein
VGQGDERIDASVPSQLDHPVEVFGGRAHGAARANGTAGGGAGRMRSRSTRLGDA